ncbi:MAG: uracil-DNA glycosylase [Patescibacteria group bacterium]
MGAVESKNVLIDRIAEEIRACNRCPLGSGRLNTVPGSGSASAEVLFIGEGPGAQEDKQGIPFVGAAGKFLDEMLSDIGKTRADVFVTNVVKCRPPENRDPEPEEANICTETFLFRQIEAINPLLIATLGRHAMWRFISADKTITGAHGTLFHLVSSRTGKKFAVLPLYHPAAALYNGSLRAVLKEDFKKIPVFLAKIKKMA